MIKNTYFCDADGKEFNPEEGLASLLAVIPKTNDKLEKQQLTFNGNFCGEHSELLMGFISTLKNEHESRQSDNGVEHADKSGNRSE